MRKTTVIDNFLDFDLEKALINYEDRMFLFNIEETIGNFVINDDHDIEINFINKHYRNLASLLVKRYINQGDWLIFKEQSIVIKKNSEKRNPILKLTDFFYKTNRQINHHYALYDITCHVHQYNSSNNLALRENLNEIKIKSSILNEHAIKKEKEVYDLIDNFANFCVLTTNEENNQTEHKRWRDAKTFSNKEFKFYKKENLEERSKCKSHNIYKSNGVKTRMTKCFSFNDEETMKTSLFIKTDHILYLYNTNKDTSIKDVFAMDNDCIRSIDDQCCLLICDDPMHSVSVMASFVDDKSLEVKYLKEAPDNVKEKLKEKCSYRIPTANVGVFNKLVTAHLRSNNK